jgi:glycosyltransferase involved in cell wall biosynthesis
MSAPFFSVLVATYNQEQWIEAALRSILQQDCAPFEVLVGDDASTDRTGEIVAAVVGANKGPHTVRVHRHPTNIGPLENNKWLRKNARGRWLVSNDGDDLSLPGRVRRIEEVIHRTGASFVSSNAILIDAEGKETGTYLQRGKDIPFTLQEIAQQGYTDHMLGATSVFERRLLTAFGFFEKGRIAGGGGDHVIPFRAGFFGGGYYIDEPLIAYRQHPRQMTRTIADRTRSDVVLAETLQAYNLKTCMHQWQDTQSWLKGNPTDARAKKASGLVLGRMVQLLQRWSALRTHLIADGMRPTWVPRAELDAVAVSDAFSPVESNEG